jgi:hypothetical protein
LGFVSGVAVAVAILAVLAVVGFVVENSLRIWNELTLPIREWHERHIVGMLIVYFILAMGLMGWILQLIN